MWGICSDDKITVALFEHSKRADISVVILENAQGLDFPNCDKACEDPTARGEK